LIFVALDGWFYGCVISVDFQMDLYVLWIQLVSKIITNLTSMLDSQSQLILEILNGWNRDLRIAAHELLGVWLQLIFIALNGFLDLDSRSILNSVLNLTENIDARLRMISIHP